MKINKKNRNVKFIHKLFINVIISGLILLLILILYSFNTSNIILEKLVQGEVLASVMVAFPTLVTWLHNDYLSKKDVKKNEYNMWVKDVLSNENQVSIDQIMELNSLLAENEIYDFIDYKILFVKLQKQLNNNDVLRKSNRIFERELHDLNHKILTRLKHEEIEEVFKKSDECKYKFIDFNKLYNKFGGIKQLMSINENIEFINCCFSTNFLIGWEFLTPTTNVYTFTSCVLESNSFDELSHQDIKFIDDNSGYFDLFTGEFILFSESKESFKIQSGLKSDANCDNANQSQYEGNELLDGYSKGENNNFFSNSSEIYEQDYIYEERELKDAGPINDFIIGNKSIPVKIEIDSFSSINLKIIDEVINKLCQKNLSREDIFVSRSKSYIQDTKDGFKYNWRSWNVLPKEAIEKEKQIYIFSIQLDKNDNTNFTCVVFENEKLRNLLKSKRLTPDDRYYFYFASKKIS